MDSHIEIRVNYSIMYNVRIDFSNTPLWLVDPSLFASLLKLLQWGLASIYQGKLESPLIKVTLRMTFLSRQSSCVVIVPSQLANHA